MGAGTKEQSDNCHQELVQVHSLQKGFPPTSPYRLCTLIIFHKCLPSTNICPLEMLRLKWADSIHWSYYILLRICATKCSPSFVSIRFPTTIPKDKRSQMHPSLILQPSLPREKWVGRNGKDEKLKRQLDLPAKVSSKLTERNVCVKIYILFNLHFYSLSVLNHG